MAHDYEHEYIPYDTNNTPKHKAFSPLLLVKNTSTKIHSTKWQGDRTTH